MRLCGGMRWPVGPLYSPRGDKQPHGGPREGHITVMDTPPRNRPLIRLLPGVIDHKDGACH